MIEVQIPYEDRRRAAMSATEKRDDPNSAFGGSGGVGADASGMGATSAHADAVAESGGGVGRTTGSGNVSPATGSGVVSPVSGSGPGGERREDTDNRLGAEPGSGGVTIGTLGGSTDGGANGGNPVEGGTVGGMTGGAVTGADARENPTDTGE
jgi:hypothetical protein